jgi:F-box and leucine-rich repeat protein 2/20
LASFSISRNFLEKCEHITDAAFDLKKQKCSNMKELSVKFSRKFDDLLARNLCLAFPNLVRLQLVSCPIGTSEIALIGKLPQLVELDCSGDSYLSSAHLKSISEWPNLRIFHLGHFEHSDYSCKDTVHKKLGQQPLRGLYLIELLK